MSGANVKFRGKEFIPLGGGWFARLLERGSSSLYRLHWGVTRLDCRLPHSMTVVEAPDGGYLDFDDLEAAAEHVRGLAGGPPRKTPKE